LSFSALIGSRNAFSERGRTPEFQKYSTTIREIPKWSMNAACEKSRFGKSLLTLIGRIIWTSAGPALSAMPALDRS
jgi:hypothetical protein